MIYSLSVQQDRRTKAAWISANPIPTSGQLCMETDTLRWKVGDGTSYFSALPYTQLSGEEIRSANDVYAAGVGQVAQEQVYVGLLAQSGTGDPTCTPMEGNTLEVNITGSYDGTGAYYLTASSPVFVEGKTLVEIIGMPLYFDAAEGYHVQAFRSGADSISVVSFQVNTGAGTVTLTNSVISLYHPTYIRITVRS